MNGLQCREQRLEIYLPNGKINGNRADDQSDDKMKVRSEMSHAAGYSPGRVSESKERIGRTTSSALMASMQFGDTEQVLR